MTSRYDHELDTFTLQHLEKLRHPVRRDEAVAKQARAKFIAQMKKWADQPVSPRAQGRLNGWMLISNLFRRKELKPMFTAFGTLAVVLALLLGGAGATVQAAQDSLPDEALYPVKAYGEQVQLALTTRTQARMRLLLRFSDQRVDEMVGLLAEDKPIPQETQTRLEQHYQLALQAAAELDEPAMVRALQQIQARMRLQEVRLQGANDGLPEDVTPTLERVREMLRQQLRLVGDGIEDPLVLRLRLQQGLQVGVPPANEPPAPGGEGNGAGNGPQACPDCTPVQDGTGPGPGPASGPGCGDCTPALDGTGPGPGPAGEPECDDCTPALDGTGPGPGPGGDPDCDDCTPAQDGTGPGPGPQNQGETTQPGGGPTDPPDTGGDSSGGGTDSGGGGESGGNDNGQEGSSGGGSNRP